jgi:hypothetical protein
VKINTSKNELLSSLYVAVACAAALLTAGSTVASATILKITSFTSCQQNTCRIGGGTCITNDAGNTGQHCGCNTTNGTCAITN